MRNRDDARNQVHVGIIKALLRLKPTHGWQAIGDHG